MDQLYLFPPMRRVGLFLPFWCWELTSVWVSVHAPKYAEA